MKVDEDTLKLLIEIYNHDLLPNNIQKRILNVIENQSPNILSKTNDDILVSPYIPFNNMPPDYGMTGIVQEAALKAANTTINISGD